MALEAMQEIVLVRHAAASGQDPEAPLTAEGHARAAQLVEALRQLDIERVVSSPFLRAIQSVEPFARSVGLVVETDQRLCERVLSARSLPDWREHLRRAFNDLDYRLEDGESSRAAQTRAVAAVLEAAAGGQRCVIVTHGNLLALLLRWVDDQVGYELWAGLSNPDLFVIEAGAQGRRTFRRVPC
ncbi:MAG: hypothetical protein RL033_620 [Pseudomonadota bacterium]|jgi:2,3-bisphosphoglycerate-dependent phosphoglycerate mutase